MRKLFLITICLLTFATTYAQNITTIAGGLGDGILAINTSISNPYGTAVDGSGNIYIADYDNNRIRKVTASTDIITTVAGNGIYGSGGGNGSAATSVYLNNPCGVAVDGSGNVYIADAVNNSIRKVTASTGIISTVAGYGTQGYGGDGNLATSAKLNNPIGVAVDGSGNIYIADSYNNRIRKVTVSTGIISTVAGNGTGSYGGDGSAATSANLNYPSGVAVDGSGNIYIADNNNHRIRKVTISTGIISTVAGNGTLGYGGDGSTAASANLYNPNGVSVDGAGNIYIADCGNHRIRKVSASTGIISTVAGNGTAAYGGDGNTATSASIYNPYGVAVDGSGNIYIADKGNNRIRKVSASTGIISTVAGNGTGAYGGDGNAATSASINNPSGVAVDGTGNIYIADYGNDRIRKVSASTGIISTVAGNGTKAYGGDGSAATSANLNNPTGVAVDGSGNIYIADAGNSRIRKITVSTGIISTVAGNGTQGYGGDGSAATSASLNQPNGLVVDGSGNIYIADFGNNRIRKVTASTGIMTTVAGNGTGSYAGDGSTATLASLSYPSGLAVDVSGNIYIADAGNKRIRKVTASTGIISTVAGNGIYGSLGDGSAATSANLGIPYGVAVDVSGNIYIADYDNYTIRKVSALNGIINTVAGNGTRGFGGDGSVATSANLYHPWGVAADGSGNIYIADQGNQRIRLVNYSIVNNIISNSQTICAGSAPASLTGSTPIGSNGSKTYTWLRSTTIATAGFTSIPSTNTINYSPGVLTQNTWFRRYVVSGTFTDTSAAVAITVNTAIANNTITGNTQTICAGLVPATITATTATGGNSTTYKYKWLKSTTNATTGFFNAGGNDSIQNFTSGALTQNTWFKRKVISGVCNVDTTAAFLVTAKPTSVSTTIISICPNLLPFIWNGRTYNSNITDTVYLTNSVGCDSVTILKLTIKQTSSSTSIISICPSVLPYTWNGRTYNAAKTDTLFLTNAIGCDSLAILNLNVKSISTSTKNISVCPNVLPYTWNGLTFNTAGTQTKTGLINSVGCDSSATLTLTVKLISATTNNLNICTSELPYTWNGKTYNAAKTDTVFLTNAFGCDSLAILNLNVKSISISTKNISICPNALPYTWNGRTYNTAKTDTIFLINSVGCDSLAILNLSIKLTSTSTKTISICPNALPYTWNGLTFTGAGTQTKTGLINSVGCDSSATLNLSIKSTSTSTNNLSICPSQLPYTWNGLNFTGADSKTKTGLINSVGCDSSATLNLTVKSTSTSTNNLSICPSQLPYTWNGLNFTSAGSKTKTGLINSVGCDSSATLNLSIKSTSTSTNNLSICPSQLPYTWNGLNFTSAGSKTKTGLINSVGCDSTATLNLSLKSTSTSSSNLSICTSELPYVWNGLIFVGSDTKTKTGFISAAGCDSSATLILTVNSSPNTGNIIGLSNVFKLDTASYSVTGTAGSTFNWMVTKGIIQSGTGANQIQIIWNAIGTDTLKVIETSSQGCVGLQNTLIVNISPTSNINEINASKKIAIYPNPTTGMVNISSNQAIDNIEVFDVTGKLVLSHRNDTHQKHIELDLSAFGNGIYFIQTHNQNAEKTLNKVVISK